MYVRNESPSPISGRADARRQPNTSGDFLALPFANLNQFGSISADDVTFPTCAVSMARVDVDDGI